MPRVDDARVYAHTVLFFTFSSPLLPSSRLSRYAPDRASLLPFNTCSNKQGVEVENLRTTDSFLLHDETKGKLVWAEVGSDPKEERKEGRGKYGNGVLEGSARSPLVLLLLLLHVY